MNNMLAYEELIGGNHAESINKTCEIDEFDVLWNFMQSEEEYKVNKQMIDDLQEEIKWKMRAILYDWMSEVCNDYMFKRDTYYIAAKLVDLF